MKNILKNPYFWIVFWIFFAGIIISNILIHRETIVNIIINIVALILSFVMMYDNIRESNKRYDKYDERPNKA